MGALRCSLRFSGATLVAVMLAAVRALATKATTASPALQDVVIIGGGPAGLSLLAALKANRITRDLLCTLVEGGSLDGVRRFASDPPEEYTNRVVSLTPQTIEFMQEKIGNWSHINTDRVKVYDTIVAYDSHDSDARILFDAAAVGNGTLAAMCENINIQASLLDRIDVLNAETANPAEIIDNVKVESIGLEKSVAASGDSQESIGLPEAHLLPEVDPTIGLTALDWPIVHLSNGKAIQARLLVGADGYNSPVRKFAGIQSRGWQYDRFGVVATIKLCYEDYRSIGWQRFLTTGPLAILPLTDDNATIVWSSTPELSQLLLKVDPQIFPHLVNAAMTLAEVDLQYIYGLLEVNPSDASVLEEIEWRMSKISVLDLDKNYPLPVKELVDGSRARFPLKMSHADTYVAPRVALIGDAAHTIHPLAGQGLNMGQTDVGHLVAALEKGVKRGMDVGSTLVLEPYLANAWPGNHLLLGVCDKLHKVFSTDWTPLVYLRGFGMKSLNSLGVVKDMMIKIVSGS